MANDEIVVGRVESGAVGTATLEVGAQSFPRSQGNQVVVRAGANVFPLWVSPTVLVGERIEGRWGDVAQHRLAAMFVDIAPGDHVDVRISGAALAAGDVVAARVRRDANGMVAVRAARGADENAASSALLQAEAIANADADRAAAEAQRAAAAASAREQRERIRPRPPWGRTTVWFVLVALAMAVWTLVEADGWHGAVPRGSGGAAWWAMTVGLGGAALMMWATRYDLPLVHRVGVTRPETKRQVVMFLQIFMALMAMLIAAGRNKSGPATPHPIAGVWFACALPAIVALIGIVRAFAAVRGLWPIESAARLSIPPPPRTWGVLEGVVAGAGGPVLTATITRTVHTVGSGRGGWTWEEMTVATTDTIAFQLDTGSWHADVYTKGMTWAAAPAWQPFDEKRAIRAVAAVRPGDRVRVLARTGEPGDNDIRAGGPESLFLIAGTPSDFLRRALRPPFVILAYVALAIASTMV